MTRDHCSAIDDSRMVTAGSVKQGGIVSQHYLRAIVANDELPPLSAHLLSQGVGAEHALECGCESVSYTHLDVYKRQGL